MGQIDELLDKIENLEAKNNTLKHQVSKHLDEINHLNTLNRDLTIDAENFNKIKNDLNILYYFSKLWISFSDVKDILEKY